MDCCEHEHETRDEAERCLLRYMGTCRQLGKVGTRTVVECDSLDEVLDEAELY